VNQATDESKPGMTGAIAVCYFFLGAAVLLAIAMGGSIQGIDLLWSDAWLPALIVISALGILRRTHWGRWLGYLVSLPLLVGVPLGTILGGYMIWHLTKFRASFSRAY
jgi:hypothetical protein